MTRQALEHIIRASATIADDRDIVVIGSQAVLGNLEHAPELCLISREADVYPRNFPERSDVIDGAIGDGSPFEKSFGYFAHGVGPETAILPAGWEERLVRLENENTLPGRGWCLELHDLALAKYAAGRDKDLDFNRALASGGWLEREILDSRLEQMPIAEALRKLMAARIRRSFAA
ncbi:MAG: DUF6036 family nucleotidyltransferase [Bryobacter sp.]|nr:DUF6036 family nucleotidyltransferase [Bryobacter sp.]